MNNNKIRKKNKNRRKTVKENECRCTDTYKKGDTHICTHVYTHMNSIKIQS